MPKFTKISSIGSCSPVFRTRCISIYHRLCCSTLHGYKGDSRFKEMLASVEAQFISCSSSHASANFLQKTAASSSRAPSDSIAKDRHLQFKNIRQYLESVESRWVYKTFLRSKHNKNLENRRLQPLHAYLLPPSVGIADLSIFQKVHCYILIHVWAHRYAYKVIMSHCTVYFGNSN